jgi:hypothetical protein
MMTHHSSSFHNWKRKRDKTFRIGTPMRKVSWTKRFAAEDRHFCGSVARISLGKTIEVKEVAPPARNFSLGAQHEESRVLVRSRTRPKRVL